MPSFFFLLGHSPQLSRLEITALTGREWPVEAGRAIVELESAQAAIKLLDQLGGSIEVSEKSPQGFRTLQRHRPQEWIARDRRKPYADHKKGMLPPKVARMMVNLGLGQWRRLQSETSTDPGASPTLTRTSKTPRLYDPFCGTGTLLMEAGLLGAELIGSDQDPTTISGSQKNLQWLERRYQLDLQARLFQSEVSHATLEHTSGPIDILITEPFLGKPRPRPQDLPGQFRGLYKLYLGALRHWRELLAEHAIVVMVFPEASLDGQDYSLEKLIDKLPELGYSTGLESVAYSRPDAIIKRSIVSLRYVKS